MAAALLEFDELPDRGEGAGECAGERVGEAPPPLSGCAGTTRGDDEREAAAAAAAADAAEAEGDFDGDEPGGSGGP